MKCSKCHSENPHDTLYCGQCGTHLSREKLLRATVPTSKKISAAQTETLKTSIQELVPGTILAGCYRIIEELGKKRMLILAFQK